MAFVLNTNNVSVEEPPLRKRKCMQATRFTVETSNCTVEIVLYRIKSVNDIEKKIVMKHKCVSGIYIL